MTLGLLSGRGYKGSYTSSMPCSIICSRLTQFVLDCCFSSAVHSVMFNSMFPFLLHCLWGLHRSLRQHNSAISTTPQSFTSRTRWFHINYPLDLHWETWLWDCREIRTHLILDFSQRGYCYSTNMKVFSVYGHTYASKPTFTCILQCSPSSVGLAQARPNCKKKWTILAL